MGSAQSTKTSAELYRDVSRLMALSYPNVSGGELHEEIAMSHFMSALSDCELALQIREREPKDLDAAFTIAVRLEAYQIAYASQALSEPRSTEGRNTDSLTGRVAAIKQTFKVDPRFEELKKELEYKRAERIRVSRKLGQLELLDEQRRASEATLWVNPKQEVQSNPPKSLGKERRGTLIT